MLTIRSSYLILLFERSELQIHMYRVCSGRLTFNKRQPRSRHTCVHTATPTRTLPAEGMIG